MDLIAGVLRHFAAHRVEGLPAGRAAAHRTQGELLLVETLEALATTVVLDDNPPPDPDKPVDHVPGTRALLLKIVDGEGAMSFRTQEFLMKRERYISPFTCHVASSGTTWVLLRLREVPLSRSTTGMAFVRDGEQSPFRWHAITLDNPPPGHLRLEVRDEQGRRTPSLVQIRHARWGNLWPVEDHHDFRPLLHEVTGTTENMPEWLSIYGPEGSLLVPVPGEQRGHYWLVDPGVEVTLPAGDWIVSIHRGPEYVPHQGTIRIAPGEWKDVAIDLERWEDMAQRGWISGDDHVHARLMNSSDARTLMALARAMDLRVANILEMGDTSRTHYIQRGFGPEFRVEHGGTWLVPGMEDPRSVLGHHIGLNLTALVRDVDRYHALDWIAGEVRGQGGLFGQTHVGQNMCEAHRGMALMVPHGSFDFVSIMQGWLGTELYYNFLNLGFRLAASAGSDMPYAGIMGDVRVYAQIEDEAPLPDAWFDSLRKGRTFVTNGPMLELLVNGHGPGSVVSVEADDSLVVSARAWGLGGHSAPVVVEIVKLGETIARETGETSASASATLAAGNGFWIAARAHGANGSSAHTTPVYVQREGFRHWKVDAVGDIIATQMGILDEIDGEIAKVEQALEAGTLNRLDFNSVRLAHERHTLRLLVESTREIYESLLAESRVPLQSRNE